VTDALPALAAIALLAIVALVALAAAPPGPVRRAIERRTGQRSHWVAPGSGSSRSSSSPALSPLEDVLGDDVGLRPAALGRIVRVATWIFLFAATTLVAVTGLWADRQGPILVLLAAAGLYGLVLHEFVPVRIPLEVRLAAEAVFALSLAALLVLLTGGTASPFFFAFPLLVGGAALVVSSRATVALATLASLAYLGAIAGARQGSLEQGDLAVIGTNLTALLLLAYVGSAVGREQRRAREEALRRATVDPLTGLRTRAFLFTALEREINRSQRTGRRFCLLMMDLDDLKMINDRHGHHHGDRILRAVGEVIRDGIRRIDTGARYGGDEFVVLLPETDPTGGWVLAEKIRRGVAELSMDAGGHALRGSLSIGLVTHPDDGRTADELMIRADEAMYRSKQAGRDRVSGPPVVAARVTDLTAGHPDPAPRS
jgi:diguanylate cyclase (GGDEF)-like protein